MTTLIASPEGNPIGRSNCLLQLLNTFTSGLILYACNSVCTFLSILPEYLTAGTCGRQGMDVFPANTPLPLMIRSMGYLLLIVRQLNNKSKTKQTQYAVANE